MTDEVKREREGERQEGGERGMKTEETKGKVEIRVQWLYFKSPIFLWLLFCLFPISLSPSLFFHIHVCWHCYSQCFSHWPHLLYSTIPSTGSPGLGFFYYFLSSLSLSLCPLQIFIAALVACMDNGKMKHSTH